MKIDEKKEVFDLSDHCMIELKMNIGVKKKVRKEGWNVIRYYTTTDKPLEKV